MIATRSPEPANGTLKEVLTAVLSEVNFDIEYGQRPPSHVECRLEAALRETCFRPEEQAINRRVRVKAPEALMAQLVAALRLALEDVIDPETDKIGHAFPTETSNRSRLIARPDGLYNIEFISSLTDFASAVIQASAIIGVEKTISLLEDWGRGASVRIHMSTVLNNLFLSAPLSPRDDVHVVPLPLTTTQLPRVPITGSVAAKDYLGLTLLKLEISASPALFRPNSDERATVESRSADGLNLDVLCEALSLQTNRYVSRTHLWHDHQDAAAFRLAIPDSWSQGGDRMERIPWKRESHDYRTGAVTVLPHDHVFPVRLEQCQLCDTLEALRRADKKLRIAAERWRRSKRRHARLEDAYIDLRIALESLYLKDFVNEQSGEMRFRLSLMGAWHLSADLDERRSTRKILRDAYDTASKAVHLGEVPREAQANLSAAQDLCRRGILRLLRNGPPRNWGDVVLGDSAS